MEDEAKRAGGRGLRNSRTEKRAALELWAESILKMTAPQKPNKLGR